jgi:hypothetical protein
MIRSKKKRKRKKLETHTIIIIAHVIFVFSKTRSNRQSFKTARLQCTTLAVPNLQVLQASMESASQSITTENSIPPYLLHHDFYWLTYFEGKMLFLVQWCACKPNFQFPKLKPCNKIQ